MYLHRLPSLRFLLLLLLSSSSLDRFWLTFALPMTSSSSYKIRQASDDDVSLARSILLQQAMNPLSLSSECLLVACSTKEDEDNNNRNPSESVLGFGQIRPLDEYYSELASLYVQPEYRSQGIGSEIVQSLVERHNKNKPTSQICLLTLKSTTPFYKKFGFQEVDDKQRKRLPKSIQLEYQAGRVVSFLLRNDLVCMIQGDPVSI